MSKKKIGMISGIFGFSLAIGLGIVIKDYCQDRQRRQMTRDLRTFFFTFRTNRSFIYQSLSGQTRLYFRWGCYVKRQTVPIHLSQSTN